MELLQLIYFRDAAQSENFTVTARRFIVPPSAVSQSIKRLEGELGVALFDRKVNRVQLSREGQIFYKSVSTALDALDAARLRLKQKDDTISGEIRLLVSSNRRGVALAVEAFRREYPNVDFSIDHFAARDRWDYDLIISDDAPDFVGMKKALLCREKMLLAMQKDYPCQAKELRDLCDAEWVCMSPNTSLRRYVDSVCRRAGFVPRIIVQCDDPSYVRKYVEFGMGVALVPSYSWQGGFSENVRLEDVGELYRDTYVFFTHDPSTACVRLFAERMMKQFEQHGVT